MLKKTAALMLAAGLCFAFAPPAAAYPMEDALFKAAASGDVWTVRRMVESGAYIHALDRNGLTPLAWAAQFGRADVAGYLIQAGAAVNPTDHNGFTPLMWAAQEGHASVVGVLLASGANPRVIAHYGMTALALSQYSGNWRSVELISKALGYASPPAGSYATNRAYYPNTVPNRAYYVPPQARGYAYAPASYTAAPYAPQPYAYAGQPYAYAGQSYAYAGQPYAYPLVPYHAPLANGAGRGYYYQPLNYAYMPGGQYYRMPASHRNPGPAPAPAAAMAKPVAAKPPMPMAAPVVVRAAAPVDLELMKRVSATKALAETAAQFGDMYTLFLRESTSGGMNMNALASLTSPEMELGKSMTTMFANFGKTNDFKQAREDLNKAKGQLNGNAESRFARYVANSDKILSDAGF